jgi:probable phosphoglycerate mutase
MPIVYLLRHAQSEANIKGILAGRDDSVNLSKFGQKQASNLVGYLENLNIHQVYCSPLARCIQTINPYMKKNPRISFDFEPQLLEMDYGTWSGKSLKILSRNKLWKLVLSSPEKFKFPEGESFKQMRQRVDLMIEKLSKAKEPVLLVTHGDIIKMFITSALNAPINQFQSYVIEPGSITTLNISKSGHTVLQTNYSQKQSNFKAFRTNILGGGNLIQLRAKRKFK